MTLVLRMKSNIINANAPKLIKYDPVEHRTGSLFLWDAGLSSLSSMPAVGAALPNLLAEYTNAAGKEFTFAMGGTSQSEHDSYVKREMTTKKGLHWMVSQSRATDLLAGNTYYGVKANAALKTHLANNIMGSNPSIFISIWLNATRYVTKVNGLAALMAYVNGNTTNIAAYLQQDKTSINLGGVGPFSTVSKLNLTHRQASIVNNPNFFQAKINGYGGTGITTSTDLIIGSGHIPPYAGSIAANQSINASPSYILYRIYIEDLSLSGRTFDQVKAIDADEHTKAFGVGGRFYGDTWSDPAAVLP